MSKTPTAYLIWISWYSQMLFKTLNKIKASTILLKMHFNPKQARGQILSTGWVSTLLCWKSNQQEAETLWLLLYAYKLSFWVQTSPMRHPLLPSWWQCYYWRVLCTILAKSGEKLSFFLLKLFSTFNLGCLFSISKLPWLFIPSFKQIKSKTKKFRFFYFFLPEQEPKVQNNIMIVIVMTSSHILLFPGRVFDKVWHYQTSWLLAFNRKSSRGWGAESALSPWPCQIL